MEDDKPVVASDNQAMFNELKKPEALDDDGPKWVDVKDKTPREID